MRFLSSWRSELFRWISFHSSSPLRGYTCLGFMKKRFSLYCSTSLHCAHPAALFTHRLIGGELNFAQLNERILVMGDLVLQIFNNKHLVELLLTQFVLGGLRLIDISEQRIRWQQLLFNPGITSAGRRFSSSVYKQRRDETTRLSLQDEQTATFVSPMIVFGSLILFCFFLN